MHILQNCRILLFHLGILDIAVAHQMVSLLARAFRSGSVETFLPSVHTLADMHTAVIDKRSLDDVIAGRLENVRYR